MWRIDRARRAAAARDRADDLLETASDWHRDDQERQTLALIGIGHALIGLLEAALQDVDPATDTGVAAEGQ